MRLRCVSRSTPSVGWQMPLGSSFRAQRPSRLERNICSHADTVDHNQPKVQRPWVGISEAA